MKLSTTFTFAIAAAGAFALGASTARAIQPTLPNTIGFSTNYDALNIALTVQTTTPGVDTATRQTYVIKAKTYNDQSLLALLSSQDFAGEDLTNIGARLVVSWDAGANVTGGNLGDILVVKGTNVFYDATAGTIIGLGTTNGTDTNYMMINFFYGHQGDGDPGAYAETAVTSTNAPQSYRYIVHDIAEFAIYDNAQGIDLDSFGPDTINFGQNTDKYGNDTMGSESLTALTSESDYDIFDSLYATTVTARISGSGHTKGADNFYSRY